LQHFQGQVPPCPCLRALSGDGTEALLLLLLLMMMMGAYTSSTTTNTEFHQHFISV